MCEREGDVIEGVAEHCLESGIPSSGEQCGAVQYPVEIIALCNTHERHAKKYPVQCNVLSDMVQHSALNVE